MKEKIIEGFSDYIVHEEGYLTNRKTGKHIYGGVKKTGYVEVCIKDDSGKQKSILLHRIVAKYFCKKEKGQTEINHINGNKKDNCSKNLEWICHGDNLLHAYKTGLMPNNTYPKKVIATDMHTGEKQLFDSIYHAAKTLNISQGNICMCCQGKRPYANGFYWQYAQGGDAE